MPSTSKKQEKFMQAVAHNPAFAKKVGVPQKVGKEFTMKKYAKGGKAHADVMSDMPMMKKVAKGEVKKHEKAMHKGAKKYAKGGSIDGCATKGKTKGTMVKMAGGGKC